MVGPHSRSHSENPENRRAARDRKPPKTGATVGNPSTRPPGYIGLDDKEEAMRRRVGTVLMALAVVTALLAIPIGIAAATNEHDEDREPTTAGEQLGGVVSVQGAELDGNLSERTYGVRIANAEADRAKARIVDERLDEIEDRIADHEARLAELEAEREAGNISEGTYRAQVATLTAEQASTERAAERAGDTARGLPEEALAERGVSTDRIDDLRVNASRAGGPDQREIARGIAGGNVSSPLSENPSLSENQSPAGERRAATDSRFNTTQSTDNTRDMSAPSERSGPNETGSTDQSPREDVDKNESSDQTPGDSAANSDDQTSSDSAANSDDQTSSDGTSSPNGETTTGETDDADSSNDQRASEETTAQPNSGAHEPRN